MSRTNKTKELLAQSLTELMVTTPLEKISVNDIVEHAGVGAQHLYYHFEEDKFDLVNWYFQSGATQFLVTAPLQLVHPADGSEEYLCRTRPLCKTRWLTPGRTVCRNMCSIT